VGESVTLVIQCFIMICAHIFFLFDKTKTRAHVRLFAHMLGRRTILRGSTELSDGSDTLCRVDWACAYFGLVTSVLTVGSRNDFYISKCSMGEILCKKCLNYLNCLQHPRSLYYKATFAISIIYSRLDCQTFVG